MFVHLKSFAHKSLQLGKCGRHVCTSFTVTDDFFHLHSAREPDDSRNWKTSKYFVSAGGITLSFLLDNVRVN